MSLKKGFTLIEMLIVVAVVGILASLVLVGLGPVQRQARDARRISDLRQVQTGLELYFVKYGTYPDGTEVANWADLVKILTIDAGIGITTIPSDPINNGSSTYKYGSDGTSYVLGASLEDGKNRRLDEDIDGSNVHGVNCEEPVYCVQL